MLGKKSCSLFQCYYICIWDYGYCIKNTIIEYQEKDNNESVHVYVNWDQAYWP